MNIVRALQRDALRLRLRAWRPCSWTATTVSWWKPTASAVLRVLEIPITSQYHPRKVPKQLGNVNPWLINHGLWIRKYSSNSHFIWYFFMVPPQLNSLGLGVYESRVDITHRASSPAAWGCWSWWRREMLRDAMNFSEVMPCMWTFRTPTNHWWFGTWWLIVMVISG